MNESKAAAEESGEAVKDIIDATKDTKERSEEVTFSMCVVIGGVVDCSA